MAKQKPSKPAPVAPAKKTPAKLVPDFVPSVNSPVSGFPMWFGLLAAAVGFLVFANTLGHQYALDDYGCLKDNYIVQGGLKNLGTIFTTEYRYGYKAWASIGSLYRPATLGLFAWEWSLSPDNTTLFHFMNVLWFALTGWLLWATWRRILADYSPVLPALAALFFMAHPVHCEVVANIKSRDEIMSLFFCTAALYGLWRYFEKNSTAWLVAAVSFFGFAYFFKESTITFLAVFPLCIWFFTKKSLGENLKITGLMLIPTVVFLLFRQNALAGQGGRETYSILDNFIVGAPNVASRLASAFLMCGQYLKTLAFPHPLVSDLGYSQMSPVTFGDWRALLGFALYVGMFVWALVNLKNKHILAFAILFYLATFSISANVLTLIGTSYGERLLYMPSLGFVLALAWAICKVLGIDLAAPTASLGNRATLLWGLAAAITLLYGAKTVLRNPAWYNSATLYAADIVNSPNSAKLNYHHALEYAKAGYDDDAGKITDSTSLRKAIETYTNAIKIYPEYHDAFGSRGTAHLRLAEYDLALRDYEHAVKLRPNDSKVYSNMGFIYMLPVEQGGKADPAKAEEVYRLAVKWDPRFVDARRNLGALLAMKRQFPEAIEQWKEGLKIEPDNYTLLFYIGSAYRDMGQAHLAQPWFDKAEAAKRKPKPKE